MIENMIANGKNKWMIGKTEGGMVESLKGKRENRKVSVCGGGII